jgi:hypothetical protein
MPTKRWIQTALRKKKKGALSRQLGIPEEDKIPVSLLQKIRRTEIGKTITNPTTKGKKRMKVTRLLKKRSVVALTLKELRR